MNSNVLVGVMKVMSCSLSKSVCKICHNKRQLKQVVADVNVIRLKYIRFNTVNVSNDQDVGRSFRSWTGKWLNASAYVLTWPMIKILMVRTSFVLLALIHVDNSLANCMSLTCSSLCC